ncbi:hypothetical protein FISHEDRAFT_57770 [Fistulina hepatica ATCC 64428]|uniref:Protein kinase domain-containing protein n=1 Tax=Fistulina hepatica ATCC 64428 TaxID=1128425 RepID=A0A0D7AF85_9AGAR|nr:hypothetical protein FISHEDRAFT_57770 [Fistulina hepatica ATCC 64428]
MALHTKIGNRNQIINDGTRSAFLQSKRARGSDKQVWNGKLGLVRMDLQNGSSRCRRLSNGGASRSMFLKAPSTAVHDPQDYIPGGSFYMRVGIPGPPGAVRLTKDGRHVVIRLMDILPDGGGQKHIKALRTIAMGVKALHADNHAVPVLEELHDESRGLIFFVFPMLASNISWPWFYDLGEFIDWVEQAIQDIAEDNFLWNVLPFHHFMGYLVVPPLRSLFPVRYYLNDFEMSVTFESSSEPSSRVISGCPSKHRLGGYARMPYPEMLTGEPYCPFRADIWQLGTMFRQQFIANDTCPKLTQLFETRPTAAEALARVIAIRKDLTSESLRQYIFKPFAEPHIRLGDLPDEAVYERGQASDKDGAPLIDSDESILTHLPPDIRERIPDAEVRCGSFERERVELAEMVRDLESRGLFK